MSIWHGDPAPVVTGNVMVTTGGISWNGPICQVCSKPYLGTHSCLPADLRQKAADLVERAERLEYDWIDDETLSADETLAILDSLNPLPTRGPRDD